MNEWQELGDPSGRDGLFLGNCWCYLFIMSFLSGPFIAFYAMSFYENYQQVYEIFGSK